MLFALVLFLIAVGERFRLRGVRVATIAMAFGLFACGLYDNRHPATALSDLSG